MSKTTTTCPIFRRGAFQIALAVAAFFMVDPYIRKLLSFVQEHCIAELSPHWFGAFVCLLVVCCFYILLGRYRNTYIPVQLRWGLLLLAVAYLYYRISPCYYYRLSPEFYFWRIPLGDWMVFRATWTDLLLLPLVVCVWLARKKKDVSGAIEEAALEQMGAQAIQNDVAIERECDDWLGFSSMVGLLFEDLSSLDLSGESLTMGIIAQWGKGKSSFINLLMNKVKEHGDIIIRFNPRSSKNVSQIQEDFFDAFAKELSKYYIGFGFLLGRYTKHLGLLGQYEWTRPLESLLTLLLPEKDEQAINAALYSIGRRVYVVIDDLDRLTGEEIIEVLKLVDRNASFNNVVFVMAYDKEYINNVLRKHLDHGLDHSFIDKYVTWEVTIPEVDGEVLKAAMERYLKLRMPKLSIEELQQTLDGWGSVSDIITGYLESVRHLKRYLNLMIPRYREVYYRVNPADFFLVSLLQYRYLSIYNNLTWRMYVELNDSMHEPCYYISPERWTSLRKELPHEVLPILNRLFVKSVNDRNGVVSYRRRKLIRSTDAFPYYFRYERGKAEEK
ncbi:P-loop NTPase fold protein [Porphyromonas bobii]|jgi:P-loop domain protein, KAP family|uniref:P-loop NTPase fold protein n=1 Tax=Porphyromonas bobii TaxID=2811780 RepID=UPI001C007C66|nr:P-loop NTPase fold protein [Porphyromonas bobii]